MKQTYHEAWTELGESLRDLKAVILSALEEFPPSLAYLSIFCLGGIFGLLATLFILGLR